MGEWQETQIGYLKAHRVHCELCGQPIPGRHWRADVDGTPRIFCSPAHERMYHEYWLPRYGGAAGNG